MTYSTAVSRVNPTCFLFLIDQSGSMSDPFGGSDDGRSKAAELADSMNRLLSNLVVRCSKGEEIWRYFQVGMIGYGASVESAFGSALAGQNLVWIDDLAMNPLRVEDRVRRVSDGAGGLVEVTTKLPVWLDVVAANGTPMRQALEHAHQTLSGWISQHDASFPPIVINISDGEATDVKSASELVDMADAIKSLRTNDGNVILLNLHLSSNRAPTIQFPNDEKGLADDYARLLFQMSSVLPESMGKIAKEFGYTAADNARGFVFNARLEQVIDFLEIGTRPSNPR